MKASVIIPANNNPDEVLQAVRSLRSQVLARDDVEVIVVDDGSEPPLEEFIRENREERLLRLIRNEEVGGRGQARNTGLQASLGEIVIFMDSDMTAHPEFVSRHIEAHETNWEQACVGHVIWTGTSRLYRYLETRGVKKLKNGKNVPWRYLDSSNFSCRKTDLERAGSFNTEIKKWGGEDTLMGYDLNRTGVSLTYLRGAVTYHHSRVELGELCEKNYTFGRYSMPIIIHGRPEISRELRTHYLMTPSKDEGWSIKEKSLRLLVRSLIRFPGHRAVKSLLSISGKRISMLCYDYLVYSSILSGFRDYLQSDGEDACVENRVLNGQSRGDDRKEDPGVTPWIKRD